MKKICSLFLVVCLIFLLSACGGNESTTNSDTGSYCVECGEAVSLSDNFCSSCGAPVNETDSDGNNETDSNGNFETLKYSGSNQGMVAEDINLPAGQYRVLISFEGTSDFEGWLNVHLNGDSYQKNFSSVDSGSAQATIIDGPVENGFILIDGHDGNWEITIEAY